MSNDKQPAGLGFADELDGLNVESFKPAQKKQAVTVDKGKVREVAESQGFTSREAAPKKVKKTRPKKEPTDQINFRAKISVLERFRSMAENQEPPWSLGYTLERALKALEKELK